MTAVSILQHLLPPAVPSLSAPCGSAPTPNVQVKEADHAEAKNKATSAAAIPCVLYTYILVRGG